MAEPSNSVLLKYGSREWYMRDLLWWQNAAAWAREHLAVCEENERSAAARLRDFDREEGIEPETEAIDEETD